MNEKIELTIEELKALMFEATKHYNLTEYERTKVSQNEGFMMYIDRLIKNFKDANQSK